MGRQDRSLGSGLLERTGGKRLDRPAQQCLRTVARAYTPRPRAPEDLRLLMRRASLGPGSLQVAPVASAALRLGPQQWFEPALRTIPEGWLRRAGFKMVRDMQEELLN